MNKSWFPKVLLLFIIMIGITNAFAEYYFLYWRFLWLDMPMHFLGGVWIGLAILWFYYLSGQFKNIPESHRRISCACLIAGTTAIIIGIFWEIFELNRVSIISFKKFNGFNDTISDILFAIAGALFSARYFIGKEYYKKQEHNILKD